MARRPGSRTLLAAAAAAALAAHEARAQDASGYMELTAAESDVRTEDSTGRRTEADVSSFLQQYSLDLTFRPAPNLNLLLGGLFERVAGAREDDLGRTESIQRRVRPYLTAALRNAIFNASFGFYRNEEGFRAGGASSIAIQEIYNSTLGWRPERLPRVTLRFIRTNSHDAERQAQDTTDDLADLVGEYEPIDNLQVYYRGSAEETDDRLQEIRIKRTTHAGRLTYGDSWWNQRVHLGAEYDVNRLDSTVTTSGIGEVVAPVFPIAGLAAISDTPLDVTLLSAAALIDAQRSTSAGINLGLQPLGGDERPRNLGLDLGGATPVNTLFVWVDRNLPPGIAASFSWEVYTSSDNITWTLQETVAPAPFGPFEWRFEIRFTERTARYIKVVTRPLARTVPSADTFPEIWVTELAGALRVPAAEAEGRTTLTTELLTTNLRARVMQRPSLDYELGYFLRQSGTSASTYTLSNGFSLRHTFSPVYSVTARAAREDGRESGGDRSTYIYSASLRHVPLATLQNSLVFSGRSSTFEGLPSRSNSLFLYSTAELYRGINAILGLGRSAVTAENGEETDTTQVSAQMTLVPHRTTTLNLLFQSTDGVKRGGSLTADQELDRLTGEVNMTFRPFSTLYFFFSYRLEDDVRTGDRFIRAWASSWSPFPDGRLQVLFSYDETFRSDLEALSRIFSPRVRWNITDRWYAEAAYQSTDFDSTLDRRQAEGLSASMRIWF